MLTPAEKQRRYRERKAGNGNAVTVTRGNAVTDGNGHAECEKKIRALEGEVAHLKRALALAGQRVAPMPKAEESAAAAVGLAEKLGGECIHGGVYGACRKLGCRPK